MSLPSLLALAERRGDTSLVDRARVARVADLNLLMMAELAGSGARYVSLYRTLCPQDIQSCVAVTPGEGAPVQFDYPAN